MKKRWARPQTMLLAIPISVTLLMPTAGAAQDACLNEVNRFGGPNRFAPGAPTIEDLKAMVREHRSEIEAQVRQTGWNGNVADLLAVLESGNGVAEASYMKDEREARLMWMLIRKSGEPTFVRDACWVGESDFGAWTFNVTSQGYQSHFIIPKACGNLSLVSEEKIPEPPKPEPPVCRLTARTECQQGQILVDATGSSDDVAVRVEGPGGLSAELKGGPTFVYDYPRAGAYTFIAEGSRGDTPDLQCSAEARVDEVCALGCDLSFSPDEISVGDEASVNIAVRPERKVESVTLSILRNGEPFAEESLSSPYSWRGSMDKAGTYSFEATVEGIGDPASCAAGDLEVVRDHRWALRIFGIKSDASAVNFQQVNVGTEAEMRERLSIGNGDGFGLGLEYIPLGWLGIELSVSQMNQDAHWVFDSTTQWLMSGGELETFLVTIGPNFHLLPDRRFDLFVGPFIGRAMNDELEFLEDDAFEKDVDDETVFGAQIGFDVPVCARGLCWSLTTGLQYLSHSVETQGLAQEIDFGLDPLIFKLGAALRF